MTEIYENYEIKNESTFKIGGCVDIAAFPSNINDFIELIKSKKYNMFLGGCSNILFSSGEINKKIIITKNIKDYFIKGKIINVSCGTRGPLMAKIARDNGLSGFEFLIGFPGTFGGMISMNASAHNQSISDYFLSANVYDIKNNQIINLKKDDMKFSYRKSLLSDGGYVLLDAQFELNKDNLEEIDELMKRNVEYRTLHQPSLSFGNAGSVFKNPENDSAGRLLDLCGLKGAVQGGAKVFDKHANFIINCNNATSSDVITLMYKMYSNVREKYTIELKPEIIFVQGNISQENRLWEIMTQKNIHQTQK